MHHSMLLSSIISLAEPEAIDVPIHQRQLSLAFNEASYKLFVSSASATCDCAPALSISLPHRWLTECRGSSLSVAHWGAPRCWEREREDGREEGVGRGYNEWRPHNSHLVFTLISCTPLYYLAPSLSSL